MGISIEQNCGQIRLSTTITLPRNSFQELILASKLALPPPAPHYSMWTRLTVPDLYGVHILARHQVKLTHRPHHLCGRQNTNQSCANLKTHRYVSRCRSLQELSTEAWLCAVLSPTLAALCVPGSNRKQHSHHPSLCQQKSHEESPVSSHAHSRFDWLILGTVREKPIKFTLFFFLISNDYAGNYLASTVPGRAFLSQTESSRWKYNKLYMFYHSLNIKVYAFR